MGAEASQQTQNKDEPILIENENEIFKDNKKEEILETKGLFHPSRAADETVIKIQIPQTIKEQLNNSEFILILDISGAMGNYVNEIITRVMPKVFDLLKYPKNKKFYFISFESNIHYHEMTKDDFLK